MIVATQIAFSMLRDAPVSDTNVHELRAVPVGYSRTGCLFVTIDPVGFSAVRREGVTACGGSAYRRASASMGLCNGGGTNDKLRFVFLISRAAVISPFTLRSAPTLLRDVGVHLLLGRDLQTATWAPS